jgi:hypothetical protein
MVERVRANTAAVATPAMNIRRREEPPNHDEMNNRVDAAISDFDSGRKVNVACKLPNGLLLRLFLMVPRSEATPTGSRNTIVSEQIGPTVRLNGFARAWGVIPDYPIIGGYAITKNVPKEFFDTWLEQNKHAPFVKNKLVWAYEQLDKVEGQAKEWKDTKSGLEPLDPNKLPPTGNRFVKLETFQKDQ